jgi:hypothetical protein
MKTFLIAILMFAGIAVVAPDAEARHYRHGGNYYSRPGRVYYSGYRHYPRYYRYHRPYYGTYYRSYYRPSYYSHCSPYYGGYYRRPGVSISFGF